MKIDKERTFTISWSAVVSIVGSLTAVWAFGAPIIEGALAQEIKKQVAPLSNAFEVTLQQNVNTLRKTIAALEFKRDMCGTTPDCWTVRDAQDLTFTRDDLRAAEMALAGIKESKR